MPKFYLVAGESSGDLHGSNLIKALRQKFPNAEFRGVGGDLMEAAGMTLDRHFKDVAYMGFVEVILHLRKIMQHLNFTVDQVKSFQADALILIDYPGFNLRLAKRVRAFSPKIIYYISPQIWAWKEKRALEIKAHVDEMITILPFEKKFYEKYNMDVHYVGHPLLDAVKIDPPSDVIAVHQEKNRKIALLPGSRKQEISRMLPLMIEFSKLHPEFVYQLAAVSSIPSAFYKEIIGDHNDSIHIIKDQSRKVLQSSFFAFVTSGTATLETALLNVPQIVLYKSSPISIWIAKRFIKVKYISLVNLIMDKPVVKELIQSECTLETIHTNFQLISQPMEQKKIQGAYVELKKRLGNSGASNRAAEIIKNSL